jgi:hypothetical protein
MTACDDYVLGLHVSTRATTGMTYQARSVSQNCLPLEIYCGIPYSDSACPGLALHSTTILSGVEMVSHVSAISAMLSARER